MHLLGISPVVAALGGFILLIGLAAAYYLLLIPQDLRQQAYNVSSPSCASAPVDVQFRKYDASDSTPWVSGSSLTNLKVGDSVDVNCFSNAGSSLLPSGTFSVTLNGTAYTLPASVFRGNQQIRNWEITQPGTYRFTCSNTASCSNTDQITVTGTATATPSPSPSPSASPDPELCDDPSIADVNADCKVDLLDYDLFLFNFVNAEN